MSCCNADVDTCITRGTDWSLTVEFTMGFEEVHLDPDDYEVQMILRNDQDDGSTVYLTITAPIEITEDLSTNPVSYSAIAILSASPAETQALPAWDLVGYTDLRTIGGASVRRLFNSNVEVSD